MTSSAEVSALSLESLIFTHIIILYSPFSQIITSHQFDASIPQHHQQVPAWQQGELVQCGASQAELRRDPKRHSDPRYRHRS